MFQESRINIVRQLRSWLSVQSLLANVAAGIISGTVVVFFHTSLVTLNYSGPLAPYAAYGISFALMSSVIAVTVVALRSSIPISLANPDSSVAAISALVVGHMASVLAAAGATERILPTALVFFSCVSVGSGLVFFAVSRFRLGRAARYMPYAVVGGSLAGSGYFLTSGSLRVMTGLPMTFANLPALVQTEHLVVWVPGVLIAIALLVCTRLLNHYLVTPGIIAGSILLFHLFFWWNGIDHARAIGMGWLMQPLTGIQVRFGLTPAMLTQVDWALLATQVPQMAPLFLIITLGLMFGTSGLELALDRSADLDRELRAAGLANLLVGPLSSLGMSITTSGSILNHAAGATNRVSGLCVALVFVLFLLFGNQIISVIPIPVLAGLLFYIGLSLLIRWLYQAWFELNPIDYAIIWVILGVMITMGFLPGIITGLVIASLIFTVLYSRGSIIKQELLGADYPSNRMRTRQQQRVLAQQSDQIRLVWLQGYLFFGTATQLLERAEARMTHAEAGLRFLIVDFRHVSGIDVSALATISKLKRLTAAHAVTLVFTSLSDALRQRLDAHDELTADPTHVRVFADTDFGMEWCESQLLDSSQLRRARYVPLPLQLGDVFPETDDILAFMGYLEAQRVQPGDVLLARGAPLEAIYFIEYGQVTVYTELDSQTTRRIKTLGAGAILGELGLYRPSTATDYVVAEQRTRLYLLTHEALARMQRESPQLASSFYALIARLAASHHQRVARTIDHLLA